MHITFTEEAAKEIDSKLGAPAGGKLKLVYDAEGCGCAVSGVPTLWITDKTDSNDFTVQDEPYLLLMDRKHEVFFEENMIIDYNKKGHCFILKGGGQIYNAHMRLLDER